MAQDRAPGEPWPDDLLLAAAVCREALLPALGEDWSRPAGDLTWDCRRTLDHVVDALLFYTGQLTTRATRRLLRLRNGDSERPVEELLEIVGTAAAVLAEIVRAAPAGTRAFHPAGMADGSGFVAMGCTEILIHTDDIAQGLALPFRPPDALTAVVLTRIFPWAPLKADPWAAFRWACGRASLPDRDRLAPDWWWHCAPLSEWDGTRTVRTVPPGWS
ncbi:MAG: hypothetical protein M3Q03_15495 [Chloroflexota bacterium]|nr:hypothetical protein [Chloroflexota bacterium]